MPRLANFLAELKRRKVYRAAGVYAVVGLTVLGAAEVILDPLGLSEARPLIVVLVLLGYPIALTVAWAYELRPEVDASPVSVQPVTSERRTSIVVLPFTNLSPHPEDAYFSDGLTEEIITNLAYVRSLRIISRSTSMVLKDAGKDIRTIGRELGIQYVLEGSVRKAGDKLRVTAQLIDANSDEHLWADRHDGTMGDVFDVQEKIAKHVAGALRLRLTPREEHRLQERSIDDPKAYETCLLAMHEGRKFTTAGIESGIQRVEQALAVVGDNARLHASLSWLYWAAYDFGVRHDERTLALAEQAAARALELDPTLPLALHARGLVRYKRGDLPGFVTHARAAVDLGGDSDAFAMLAFVLAEVGRTEEARHYADEATQASPLTFFPALARAGVELFDCRPTDALERLRDARNRLAPGDAFAGWWVAQMAAYAGREDEARQESQQVASMEGSIWAAFCELFSRALADDPTGVGQYLADSQIPSVAVTDEYYPVFLASVLARVGDTGRALEWIDRAIKWGFSNHRFLAEGNRFLQPLRTDSRFVALLDRAREQQSTFTA